MIRPAAGPQSAISMVNVVIPSSQKDIFIFFTEKFTIRSNECLVVFLFLKTISFIILDTNDNYYYKHTENPQ